jgi:hypothetical protein
VLVRVLGRRGVATGVAVSFGLRWGGHLAANWVMPEGSEDVRDPITRWSTERGGDVTLCCRRNRAGMPADTSGSDEKFRRPGGTICRGMKGEKERRHGATYRRSESSNGQV